MWDKAWDIAIRVVILEHLALPLLLCLVAVVFVAIGAIIEGIVKLFKGGR